MNKYLTLLVILMLLSCSKEDFSPFKNYIGYLKANDSINIPFNFKLSDSLMTITNSKESIKLILKNNNDSIRVESPFFEDFLMYVNLNDSINGYYYNNSLKRYDYNKNMCKTKLASGLIIALSRPWLKAKVALFNFSKQSFVSFS